MTRSESPLGAAALAASLLPVLVGLAASAILAVDYTHPIPVFCSEGGCAEVRRTAFAAVLGIPTPFVGIAGFFAIGATSLWPGKMGRAAQLVVSSPAAAAGAFLLATQWVLGHFCVYCVAADTSAIASAAVAIWRLLGAAEARPPRGLAFAGGAAMGLAVAVPVLMPVRTPAAIKAEMARTPPGQVTVVDFVDFECPFCRMTNEALEPLLAAHAGRVRLVRVQMPLASHRHAHDAARAASCAEAMGKGDAMAAALFATPVEDLTPEGCEKVAGAVGLPPDAFRACVADPKTDARIEADRALFKATGGFALPTIWIDERPLVGAQPPEALASALDGALAKDARSGGAP